MTLNVRISLEFSSGYLTFEFALFEMFPVDKLHLYVWERLGVWSNVLNMLSSFPQFKWKLQISFQQIFKLENATLEITFSTLGLFLAE